MGRGGAVRTKTISDLIEFRASIRFQRGGLLRAPSDMVWANQVKIPKALEFIKWIRSAAS